MEAVLLGPGEGETISDEPTSSVLIKADREELALTGNRYGAGESGPGAHVHRAHADGFYVTEGELTFELAGETVRAPAGGFVLVPPGVVHTFRNEGPPDARFLNVHAPSAGFAEHLRAMRDGDDRAAAELFDTFDPPPGGGRPASEAIVCPPGGGRSLELGAPRIVVKAGRHDAGGGLAALEVTLPPGAFGPVAHRHESFTDSFYVLEGTLAVRLGERTVEAAADTYALAPPGTVHTFSNPGTEPVRFLELMAPGGFEAYLEDVAAAVAAGAEVGPGLMAEIASGYDVEPAG